MSAGLIPSPEEGFQLLQKVFAAHPKPSASGVKDTLITPDDATRMNIGGYRIMLRLMLHKNFYVTAQESLDLLNLAFREQGTKRQDLLKLHDYLVQVSEVTARYS